MKYIDLRSDTVTELTPKMREAMASAEVGDDVYQDDPTVNKLEDICAKVVGKEAAMFVPTGTFGNQVSVLTHTTPGSEVILDDNCHIIQHEAGAAALISNVQMRTVPSLKGQMNPAEVEARVRIGNDIHYPQTKLICMENAHSSGAVSSLEYMKSIYAIGQKYGIPIHLDGARLFNAATYLKVDPKEITANCDSVMFCLSKGLCAPVGSMVAGTREFIDKARRNRKIMGGGMRQAGVLAAAGIIAIEEMRLRVLEDHENALYLASELAKLPGFKVFNDDININMVFFEMKETAFDPLKLRDELLKKGIKISGPEGDTMRFVTHYWINKEKIDTVISAIKEVIQI